MDNTQRMRPCAQELSHTPHCFKDHVCESPLGDSCFVMNIHNPFMHCVTSQYVFKLRDVIIGFRSRFSQCVDYMRFNEKSFCFR